MIKVYYSDVEQITINEKIIDNLPTVRKQYISSISDEKRKKQSVLVWLLLEYALKDCCGKSDYSFFVESGEWFAKDCEVNFSLSHSDNMVAVAISNNPVGVDVEKCDEKILKIASKLSDFCLEDCASIDEVERLTLAWTKKESLFKAKNGNNFFYKKILDNAGQKYLLTACVSEKRFEFINVNALCMLG